MWDKEKCAVVGGMWCLALVVLMTFVMGMYHASAEHVERMADKGCTRESVERVNAVPGWQWVCYE